MVSILVVVECGLEASFSLKAPRAVPSVSILVVVECGLEVIIQVFGSDPVSMFQSLL